MPGPTAHERKCLDPSSSVTQITDLVHTCSVGHQKFPVLHGLKRTVGLVLLPFLS